MRRPAVVLLFAVAGAAAGCSSSSNEPNPPAVASLDEFPGVFAQAYCHRAFSCCRPEDRSAASPGADEATCTVEMTENVRSNAPGLVGGGLGYFPDAGQRCLQLLASGPCGAIFEPGYGSFFACQDVFAGTGALGDACEDPRQCMSGSCFGGACNELGACAADQVLDRENECRQRVALGGACLVGVQCPAGAACANGVCKLRQPVGAACTTPEDCQGTCATTGADVSTCRVGLCSGE